MATAESKFRLPDDVRCLFFLLSSTHHTPHNAPALHSPQPNFLLSLLVHFGVPLVEGYISRNLVS